MSSAPSVSEKEEEESLPEDSSEEEENEKSVIDYESYRRVCEDYRKTTAALKERENEVATLMKDNEAKALTIKLLKDQLLSYGSTEAGAQAAPNDLQAVIEQQKQVIHSLLNTDGKWSDMEKVAHFPPRHG
mgnify:FL=1